MESTLNLYMLLLGCKPKGRHTEQHDIFFAIGDSLKALIPDIHLFWPEAEGVLHIDAWREVKQVGSYSIAVVPRASITKHEDASHLFFVNLGGYQKGLFDEPHFKVLTVQKDMAAAIAEAKKTSFYRETQFPGANSHIDDKYGLDVDDIYDVEDILPQYQREKYALKIAECNSLIQDEYHLGYFKLNKLPG
ncbi:DUF1543 domain-containing protein [Arcticibacter sp.]|uniref:DUF1543 domain-containing protein n=1 Tax=Arcticibacter sp. TaxID=1872630 RepID=UPI00388EE9A2